MAMPISIKAAEVKKMLVERVVWEVVPQMAEMLIKEEISRLTKEG